MLLENKNAVIYGGGGSSGSAVAKGFAHAGARVSLAVALGGERVTGAQHEGP